ncbi:hypothetical protein [Priestia aryabhattai]|uniref:Uncharacterized protein n=1 Tax=Priestia aryabhattai TaxID=412384 RepID=A0ABD7X4V0_PRIAR|nr:hypothetical protein [Priestia aryabhattai]WEA46799.1 hypothetical protein PWO00_12805 [Priestia aryabhattai]
MAYTKTVWNDRIKNSAGDIIQEGTPVSAGNMNKIEKGIEDAHKQMEQAGKETVSLPYGLSVLNSPNGSPLDIQIEGRTLISMGNSDLEGGKKYVLADPKTAVVIDGTTYKGVSKFEGKNARPTIIRTANFEGKVAGSTLENPHISKRTTFNDTPITLLKPSDFTIEVNGTDGGYSTLNSLNGTLSSITMNKPYIVNGISQELFSFNLIEEVERKVGRIPGSTVTDKIIWLKNNLNKLTFNWYGFGTGMGGNKATVKFFRVSNSSWESTTGGTNSHTNSVVSKIAQIITGVTNYIDDNGFVHFLAHAEASDGTAASVVNTDYADLDIELKSNADFYAPRVPLYEVPQESYDKILVEWDAVAVVRRYPMIEGAKSLQNPIVTVEGGNLLPPFPEWNLHAEASVISPYELEVSAAGLGRNNYVKVNVVPNTDYELICDTNGSVGVLYENEDKSFTGAGYTNAFPKKFNSGSNSVVRIFVTNYMSPAGKYTFSKPMLKLASVSSSEKPFVPRNPSYLYAETILRGLNNLNDMLYQDDGKWKVLKKWEEVLLDGANPWAWHADFVGYKAIKVADAFGSITTSTNTSIYQVTNHLGALLKKLTTSSDLELNSAAAWFGNITGNAGVADVILTVPDILTGWADSYTPTSDEIKAYFNGWKVKAVDGSNKPTAWVSVLDGTDAPTQTLDYVKANKAPNYTGYRLLYQLARPRVVDITDKVEGSLSVSGQVQVSIDSGVVVREKAIPKVSTDGLYCCINSFNNPYYVGSVPLKNKVSKFLFVYKNNKIDNVWEFFEDGKGYGKQRANISLNDFDPAAEYYVTYLVWDKETFTNKPVNVKASYNTSIRSTVDQMNEQLADVKSMASIHDRYLYKLLLAAKANGWSV